MDIQLAALEELRVMVAASACLQTPDWVSDRCITFIYKRCSNEPVWCNRVYGLSPATPCCHQEPLTGIPNLLCAGCQHHDERTLDPGAFVMPLRTSSAPTSTSGLSWPEAAAYHTCSVGWMKVIDAPLSTSREPPIRSRYLRR